MPTIAQGDHADLTISVASVLTMQNPCGHVLVENPIGTVVRGGGGSNWSVAIVPGDARITAVNREVYYEVAEALDAVEPTALPLMFTLDGAIDLVTNEDQYVSLGAGDSASGTAPTAQFFAGSSLDGSGGDLVLTAGTGTGAAKVGGNVFLQIGDGASGAARGKLKIRAGVSAAVDNNNAQTVTVGNVGPGAAAVQILGWLPVDVGLGNNTWLPVFGPAP